MALTFEQLSPPVSQSTLVAGCYGNAALSLHAAPHGRRENCLAALKDLDYYQKK